MKQDTARRSSILSAIESMRAAALVCFLPADLLLLTGYWPVMGGTLAVLTRTGELHVILPEDEAELASASTDAALTTYEPVTLHALDDAGGALLSAAAKLLTSLRLPEGSLATSMEDRYQTMAYLTGHRFHGEIVTLLERACPGRSIVAADAMLEQLQSIKTERESAKLRQACQGAAAGFALAPQAIVAGRREDEVAADLEAAFTPMAQEGFERGWGFFYCMSGPNSAKASGAYARTRRRVLEAGDLVMVHANTVGDGFWTDITRTYTVGPASLQQQRMYAAIAEARMAALSAIAPGVPAWEVDRAARDVLTRLGFGSNFKHATGHGVGFAAASPHACPRIHPKSPDILAAGMAFNVEPAIYFDGEQGMRHCDVVACTKSGAEVLSKF